jgi:hypothetical protein
MRGGKVLRQLRQQATFANVISSAAFFIALGGTSYALTLPRNSVGAQQIRAASVRASEIRAGAVRSSEVKDRSLGVRDLSVPARASLRGQSGPPGPPGPAGPSGVTYRAAIRSSGGQDHGNATFATRRGLYDYLVGFGRPLADCVSTATLASVDLAGTPPAGRITVAREGDSVLVKTYDAMGNAASLGFHLIVAC